MRRWNIQYPNSHVSAASQGKMSGEEWHRLTEEQKRPFHLRAMEDKQHKAKLKLLHQQQQITAQGGRKEEEDGGERRESEGEHSEEALDMRDGAGEPSPTMSDRPLLSLTGEEMETDREVDDRAIAIEEDRLRSSTGRLHPRAQVVRALATPPPSPQQSPSLSGGPILPADTQSRPPTARELYRVHAFRELQHRRRRRGGNYSNTRKQSHTFTSSTIHHTISGITQ